MTRPNLVNCDVEFNEVERFGAFANAFRIIPDVGDDVFLDFCVYSASDNRAKVVSRLRVSRDFLPLMIDRLREGMIEFGSVKTKKIVPVDGLILDENGDLVMLAIEGDH